MSALKKEENSAVCDNMGKSEDNTQGEISQARKDKSCLIPLVRGI